MARWIFVMLITALLSACDGRDASDASKNSGETWNAEQLQAFQKFKSDATQRAAVAETVARSFPAAFNRNELQVDVESDEAGSISQRRLVELLGRPSVSFSLVEHPEYLGAKAPQLDFDPRELHVLLYDVDCLTTKSPEVCSHLEAIALKQSVLRVRLLQTRRDESVALLSQPPTPPAVRAEDRRLIPEMPQTGWRKVPPGRARDLAKQFGSQSLDFEFYEHGDGDVVYGRLVEPMQLIKTSDSESVCIAAAADVLVPSLRQDVSSAELRREANMRVAVFESTIEACQRSYGEGRFVRVTGESLAAAQLTGIHDLFVRRFAAECDVPAWLTPHGLMHATGGAYHVSVTPPVSGRDRWSFDVTVEFSPAKGGDYAALVAISPWGTRLKECRQLAGPRADQERLSIDR